MISAKNTSTKEIETKFAATFPKSVQKTRGMYIFLTSVGPLTAVFVLVGTLGEHLQNRHNPRFWGTVLLPRWLYDGIPCIILYSGLESMIAYSNGFSVFMAAISGVTYAALTLNWMKELIKR